MTKIYTLVVCIILICTQCARSQVVINELYGAGGNAGATYQNDFVELYNRGEAAVSMTSWSIQYTSSGGNSWGSNKVTFSGTIPAKGFFLIKLAGGTTGTPLPAEDAAGTTNLSATSGKIVLCNDAVTVSTVANPVDANIIDKLGFGAAATGFEGSGPSPAPSATTSVQRTTPGADTDNNSTDFVAGAPTPVNASPGSDIIPPASTSLKPSTNSTDVFPGTTFSVTFSETVLKGTGNIYVKDATDNSIIQTIDVLSPGVTVSASTATFVISGLMRNKGYYIEMDNGIFKDLSGNSFAGLSGNAAWKFTTTEALYAYDFSSCTGTVLVDGFTGYSKTGTQVWACTTFGKDAGNLPSGSAPNGVQVNGYDNALTSNVPNEDWLISPAFDLSGTSFPLLSFWSRTRFNGPPLQLKVSTDYSGTGDPGNATWTDLNGRFPNQTSDLWTLSSNINLSNYKQAGVYIAFVYLSSDEEGARWTLDDVRIDNSPTPPPSSITLSTTDIQFVYTAAGSTTDRTFTLTGNDITDVTTLTATGDFQLSKDGSVFNSSISYTIAEANNIAATVYVRFMPSSNDNNYTGTITVNSSGGSSVINLKGSSIDIEKTLEVVNWNIEWFGATGFGPTNEDQQEQNVRTILQSVNADLYGLVEVVDTARLGRVVRQMPGYSYIVGNYGSYSNPYVTNPSPIGELQKLAFVYKTSVISNIDTLSLLSRGVNTAADLNNPSYNSWSSGRYPYMLSADVTLGGVTKNVKFILLHAKANTSPTITSYNRRKAGADELYSLLNTNYASDNIVIFGDFNDDLDSTITDGINPRATSYSSFINDAENYFAATLPLSTSGRASTISYSDVIDHVIVSGEMKQFFMNNSANILSDVSTLVPGYGSSTSDHYPVFTRFAFDPAILPVSLISFEATAQAEQVLVHWSSEKEINSKGYILEKSGNGKDFRSIGTVAAAGNSNTRRLYSFTDNDPQTGSNYYRLKVVDQDGRFDYSYIIEVQFGSRYQLTLSPNPAVSFVEMQVHGAGNSTAVIRFININGKVMRQQTDKLNAAGRLKIDVSALPKGVYILSIDHNNTKHSRKLVIH